MSLPPTLQIGLIGMGDMGCLYADRFSKTHNVLACDLPENAAKLRDKYAANSKVTIVDDGVAVSRSADLIVYSVEANNLKKVVEKYAPTSKVGCIVMGQSSVKQIEIDAFDEFVPKDCHIMPIHSLHGPTVKDTCGQTMVAVQHRVPDDITEEVCSLFKKVFGYRIVRMTAQEHDTTTANTQVLTHLGFQCMGTAWSAMGCYPWETSSYVGGIDNVKVLACLRIHAHKAHVYCGLAMLNPAAKKQVSQYNKSVSDIFKLMITEKSEELRERIMKAKQNVFPKHNKDGTERTSNLLLPDKVLAEYALNVEKKDCSEKPPNSHLSILAMVDSWNQLGIRPDNDLVCETPVFRLRLGIAEYLFSDEYLLEQSIQAACHNKSIRADDFEFVAAVREWSTVIEHGDAKGYYALFDKTRSFFADRLKEGLEMSSKLIAKLADLSK
eukprot:TRINITY_DN5032_c0_g1_i2.p1 TRINITY_DN5032_c0_g1~~TRINITY_DN5032_c0_g1_i2.p1  ORF type:complete len:439 (+),score=70.92 TRINITY_DN5032_c0_g1_i2:70-1386(+)